MLILNKNFKKMALQVCLLLNIFNEIMQIRQLIKTLKSSAGVRGAVLVLLQKDV